MTAHNRPFWRRLAQAAAKPATSAAAAPNLTATAGLGSSMRPLALEQRFMFDGAGAADAAHAVVDGAAATDAAADTAGALRHALMAEAAPATSQRQEVVFVDSQVANLAELLAGLSGNAEVVMLDASKDGLQQMADYLQGRSGLDAIHLLSHGADGTVQMGNVWLSSGNLAEHSTALQSIGAALKADGDLLLYGCDVGQGDKGQSFLDQLAAITGADVAASADDTGAAALGGNWNLERSSGTIETAALSVSGYDSLMAVAYSGGPVSSAPVLGTGSNLMKYVVGDFNGDGRSDILFQASGPGGVWSYAESNANGTFTVYAQGSSMFNGLALTDAATGGINYHAGDFNGDGRIDLLMAPSSGPNMTLFLNTGSGFTSQTVTGPDFGTRTLVGDFNGDGALDVLYQTGGSSSAWAIALNNGSGTPSFTTVTSADAGWLFNGITLPDFNIYSYKAADFDGDGYTDLIYVASTVQIKYFHNNHGTFVDRTSTAGLPTTTTQGNRLVVADFDGDGDADILHQINGNGSLYHYLRNDNGTFTDVDLASSPFSGVALPDMTNQNFRVGDFDGDGDIDLIATSSTTNGTSIFYQSGSLPKLVSSTPADNSLTVTPSANITLTFDQSVNKGTGNIYIVRTSDNQIIQTIDVSTSAVTGGGTTWTIDPPADMVAGVAYAVRIDNKTFANANGQVYKGIQSNTALNFTVAAVAAPVVSNLNGDTVSYTEGGADTRIDQNGNATVTDADSANFNGGNVTVTISNNGVASEDVLWIVSDGNSAGQIGVSGNNVSYGGVLIGTYTGGTLGSALVVSLNSAATPAAVTALLHNISYRNSNNIDPGTATRTVQVTINDGAGGTSAISSVALSVLSVNDAPTLTSTGSNPTYTEGGSAVQLYSGTIISTIESGQFINRIQVRVSDLANGSSEKLVVDGVDVNLTNGFGTTTINNNLGISVTVIGSVATVNITNASISVAAAQAIVDGLAYRNDSQNPSGASRTVTLFSVRDSGGTANSGVSMTTLSVASTVSLVAVNNAPTLSGGPYSFTDTNEDTTTPGVLVSSVIAAATYADVDSAGLSGIAITNTGGSGTWQYSTDNTTWTDFGAISSSSALLLTSSTYVRYIPNGTNAESVGFTYRAWDRTSDMASVNGIRGLADTTANGGSTAFSTGTATASLTVTAVNDAPVLNPVAPTLTGMTDTAFVNTGNLVSDLTGGVTDVDTGALQGVAITSLTATYGKWQFSTDSGGTWQDVGTVSTSAALVLRSTDRIRFLPDGVNGETATITYKAWDRTTGTQGTTVDTTTSGGTSAFSTATDTASVTVTAVNDRPVLTPSGGNVSWTEGSNVTSTPVVVDAGLVIADPDGPNPSSAIARVSNYYNGQDVLALVSNPATMGNIVSSWDPTTGTLTLTSAGNLATLAQFQAALRAVTYNNNSDAPTVVTRTVQFQVTDGGSLASVFVARNVTITSVDDSPTISAPVSLSVTEDIASVLDQIVIGDVDSTTANVTFSVASGSLGAIGGSGVTVSGSASALILSGNIVDINAFIAAGKLNYTTAANATANVTLGISVSNGSVSTASGSVTLQVAAVNDAPVVTVPVSIGVTEDVAGAVTGISFSDVDAGANTVTATFSVPSGTLSAIGASGVVVGGNGTGTLTLSGTLADINAFIAASNLSFKTAQDVTTNVVMTVSINDNGNTGGPSQTDSKTLTINVSAVNDAPVNNVPTAQTASQNIALGFNTANGNAISITDVDAGNGLVTVTLSATNGTLSLGSLSGITLIIGTGTNNTVLMFEGTRANLNAALQTLSFKSANNFLGAASLTIETNDNGNSGSGGAKTDTDVISITVVPVNPKVTSVSAQGIDRTVKVGDEVLINMTWDQVVNVDASGGIPSLLLETGLVDREAVYVSGSGSNTLVFKYTVQAGDLSADLDFQSAAALQLNGAVISNNTSDLAVLTLPTVGGADSLGGRSNIVVDGVVPVIGSVSAPVDGTYIPGQNLDFTVNFSENVVVDSTGGVPRIAVTLDTGGTVFAEYVSGSGSSALVFRLTAASGQLDSNGVTLGSTVQLNGGSIRDTAGNDTVVTLNSVASTGGVHIDGVAPTVVNVTAPADGSYKAGDVLTFTVNASEALQTGALPPRLVLDVGGVTRYATYVSGSGSSALVFQYVVQTGENDANGIAVNSLDLRGEQLTDLAGNDLDVTLHGVGNTAGVLVDNVAPTAELFLDKTTLNAQETAQLTIRFSEAVSGLEVADFTVTDGQLSALTSTDGGITWTATLTPAPGTVRANLSVVLNNAGYTDRAGNAGIHTSASDSYAIDTVLPAQPVLQIESNVEGNATVRVDALEAGAQWEYSLDAGQTWQAGQGNVVAIASPGQYMLQVRQTSAAGNRSEVAALTVDVAPLAVPPTVEWPVAGIFGNGGIWEIAVPSTGGAPFGTLGTEPVPPRVNGAFLGNDGAPSGALATSPFFNADVATDRSELSLGFLGFGPRSMDEVPGAPTPLGVTVLPGAGADRLVLLHSVEAVVADAGRQVDWKVPPTMFGHSDPLANVQFAMTQADGRPLPAWLKFDARTGQVSGTMPAGFQGELTLRLTARDSQGHAVSTVIKLKAGDVGPAARSGMAEQLQRHAQLRAGQLAAQRLHL